MLGHLITFRTWFRACVCLDVSSHRFQETFPWDKGVTNDAPLLDADMPIERKRMDVRPRLGQFIPPEDVL